MTRSILAAVPHALRLGAPLLGACLLGGCAADGRYPSLSPRPIEAVARRPERDATPPVRAHDPALDAQAAGLEVERAAAARGFDTGLAAARTAVDRARGASVGDTAWVVAQQAVSRLDALRGVTAGILDRLDRLRIGQAQSATPADTTRLDAVWTAVRDQAEAQDTAYAAVATRVPVR